MAELIILASPAEVVITLDGSEVAGNPFCAKVVRGAKIRRVRAAADGYETQNRVAVFDLEQNTVKFNLSPIKTEQSDEKKPASPLAVRPQKAPASATPLPRVAVPATGVPKAGDHLKVIAAS